MSKYIIIFIFILSFFLNIQTQAQVVYVLVKRDKATSNYSRISQIEDLDYQSQINYYCSVYGCNPNQLYRVMMCESGGNPNAYNPSSASGLFQLKPQTWQYFSNLSGIYGNIWNANDQIKLASWSFANGLSYHWVCK